MKPDGLAITLGAKIRTRRQELGLSQQELVAGRYSETYISRVERGQLIPSEEFVRFVAPRLETTFEELVKHSDLQEHFSGYSSNDITEFELKRALGELNAKNPQGAKSVLTELRAKVAVDELSLSLQALYYFIYGRTEMELGGPENYTSALSDLEKSISLYEATIPKSSELEVEKVRNTLGVLYYRKGNYTLAAEQHERCRRVIQEGRISDRLFRLQVYTNLANDYYCLGKPNQKDALGLYQESIKVAEEINDLPTLAALYWGMALTLRAEGKLPQALLFLDKSATLYEAIEELKLASTARGMVGNIQIDQNRYDEAVESLTIAIQIAERLGDKETLGSSYSNQAFLYYKQGQLEQAEYFATKSIALLRQSGSAISLSQGLAQLADIYLARQNELVTPLVLYEEAVQILEPLQSGTFLVQIYGRYAELLEQAGRVAEALVVYRKIVNLKDSGLNRLIRP